MKNTISVIRRKKRIKQIDLAKALSVSPSYLCKVEKGLVEPTDSFRELCSSFLEESPEAIFPPQGEKPVLNLEEKPSINNIWSARQKKNIKQNKLAELLECSPSYLSKIEKGLQQPNDKFKKKCAKILKIKESELFPEY
ncbi:MAG TPA: helix-turn-helix transcriptional regulator [Spirochaetota bacterium]|nr:helix-turn-helix transcriptional regulator [Spirochaetota bacterium]HPF05868.1 helix-turn-helix transcriptional regulator [Spirochaetota bacterium]HPJ40707.1 helix-turn-helix transcriptional regulator [Spirochaetota bacterium]HPR35976.1 helix-turn-helix transcriptional regulator [Spirochaetota bacterium]HRX45890.1 helix-turn-helix transcriptional regulator [Spirochaetota bacterium]